MATGITQPRNNNKDITSVFAMEVGVRMKMIFKSYRGSQKGLRTPMHWGAFNKY